jgi:hypothetical protein
VYSHSISNEYEEKKPGQKRRVRKKMYGKLIESIGKNKYKVLFTNGKYHRRVARLRQEKRD